MGALIKKHKEHKAEESTNLNSNDLFVLILCNDDHNTFEFVMETLITVCKHEKEQAEQCAMITHYKGKCDIKLGEFEQLLTIKRILIDKGLTAIVEKM